MKLLRSRNAGEKEELFISEGQLRDLHEVEGEDGCNFHSEAKEPRQLVATTSNGTRKTNRR